MSVYLTSSNGSLGVTPNFLTNLPKCNEVPTQSNQLVNKAYVDSNSGSGLVINQINLNDYINSLNLATGYMNIDLSSNTMNYLTNNIDINEIIALGTGMNSNVNALAVDLSGNLYAGGTFNNAGGVSVNYVAKWNGTNWSALGTGINNTVNALAVDLSGNLYAGGIFNNAGGVSANNVAKWNGTNWSALGTGIDNIVNALAVDLSGNLYAGGSFTTAGGVSANRIARWNGSTWYALSTGMNSNSNVKALAVDLSGNLYAGGTFNNAGGVSVSRIAKIDFGQYDLYSINSYVNNKHLYNLLKSQTINVNVTNLGVAYTNGLAI